MKARRLGEGVLWLQELEGERLWSTQSFTCSSYAYLMEPVFLEYRDLGVFSQLNLKALQCLRQFNDFAGVSLLI